MEFKRDKKNHSKAKMKKLDNFESFCETSINFLMILINILLDFFSVT